MPDRPTPSASMYLTAQPKDIRGKKCSISMKREDEESGLVYLRKIGEKHKETTLQVLKTEVE